MRIIVKISVYLESANNNSTLNSTTNSSTPKTATSSSDNFSHLNSSGSSSINDFDTTINGSEMEEDDITRTTSTATITDTAAATANTKVTSNVYDFGPSYNSTSNMNTMDHHANNMNASMMFIQSESTETNTSQEEVDPKSQLANKTIFKTDNPNLSIIEINENSIKEQDIENSVLVIESSDEEYTENSENKKGAKSSLPTNATSTSKNVSPNKSAAENAAEKRRRKAESLIHSSKQKLNIAIAEASAAESASPAAVVGDSAGVGNGALQPVTKREIKIYDSLEEFEKNLPSTVTVLDTPFGSKVYLVGTAHFSEDSQDDVSFVSIPYIFRNSFTRNCNYCFFLFLGYS